MIRPISLFSGLFLLVLTTNAQFIKNQKAFVEGGAFLSTSSQNPFWIRSNQYGIVPFDSQILQLRGGFKTEYDSTRNIETQKLKKKFDYAFGVEIVGNVGRANQFIIPEAYLKTRLGVFEFYAGRRREIVGLVDTTLTSGSYIWSGNALPVPKLEISIPNYTPITKNGVVAIKGNFSHGWFGNQGVVRDFYLHQKWFYTRIGRPNAKFTFYGGFNHQVQWGGYTAREKFAGGFWAFAYSVLPLKNVSEKAQGSLTIGDLENRVGNQLGSIDLMLDWQLNSKYKLSFYRQNLYDQGAALLRLANIQDGLNGISLSLKNTSKQWQFQKIGLEFFYSLNQGVSPILFTKTVAWELENYFTHYQYLNGRSYNRQIIGTPFFTRYDGTENVFPPSRQEINNDRVRLWNLSIVASKHNVYNITGRFSFSNNYGLRQFLPRIYQANQFSSLIKIERKIHSKNITLASSFAFDTGTLYKKSFGLNLSLCKTFGAR